jgi:ribosomal protein S18 acetylase RimI-like enzyme
VPSSVTQIDPVLAGDLKLLAQIHRAAFRGFFLPKLGPRFLSAYYRCVLEYAGGILLGARREGELVGFVAGFAQPQAFYAALRARRLRLALAAAPALIRRPSLLARMAGNYRRTGSPGPPRAGTPVELSSLAVLPDWAGQGIGAELVGAFCAESRRRNGSEVVLTTDAHDNDVVNRFYQSLGFSCLRTFEAQPGRALNELSKSLKEE